MTSRTNKVAGVVMLALGYVLLIPSAVVIGFVLISVLWSGVWGIGHGWPLLILSAPILVVGMFITRLGYKTLRRG